MSESKVQHLAQMNIARARFDFDDPRMAGFIAMVDYVNTAADEWPGFVWRLSDGSGKLNRGRDPREIVNLSVWRCIDDLHSFVHGGIHKRALVKRAAWFAPLAEPYHVMWHIHAGHRPTVEEGFTRLELLRTAGPGAEAFGWELRSNCFDIPGGSS